MQNAAKDSCAECCLSLSGHEQVPKRSWLPCVLKQMRATERAPRRYQQSVTRNHLQGLTLVTQVEFFNSPVTAHDGGNLRTPIRAGANGKVAIKKELP